MTRALDIKLTGYTAADFVATFTAEGVDPDTGAIDAIDISTATIVFVVEDQAGCEKWRGTVGSGIELTGEDGQFTVWIPVATMRTLCPGPYPVGCTLSDGIVTVQFIAGTLTVRDGVIG